jgi:ubiquinone/menaquinone biosynthesis C-methylase UbiE
VNDFEALRRHVELAGRTVADIGCGDGAIVRQLRDAGAEAVGVDIDIAAAARRDPEGRYLQGGAEALPLEDQSLDVAILLKSLHHVPDPHAAFPELHRVVRHQVFIAEPLAYGEFFELVRPVDDETVVRKTAQEAIERAAGFERAETFEYDLEISLPDFDAFKGMILGADPTRAERFAGLEPQLRQAFAPGDHTIPMRADVLIRTS